MIYNILMAIIAVFGVYGLLALVIIRVGKRRKERDHLFIGLGMELEMLRSEQKLHLFQMDDIVRLAYDSCNGNPDAIYNSVKNSNVIKNRSISHELKAQCEMFSKLNKRIESLEKQAANVSIQKGFNKNTVEVIDVKNEFATLQYCVKDLIDQSELAWKLVVNKLNPNPCFPLDEEVGKIKRAHSYLQEIARRAHKTIDEINAKMEPSK